MPNICSCDQHRSTTRDQRKARYELWGFDVVLDQDFKPWVIECNTSPSMSSHSPLDWKVKGSVLADALNLAGLPAVRTSTADRANTHKQQRTCLYERLANLQLSDQEMDALITFEDEQIRKAPHMRRRGSILQAKVVRRSMLQQVGFARCSMRGSTRKSGVCMVRELLTGATRCHAARACLKPNKSTYAK